mmetsp:Transcript_34886/g.110202  ORF Transcript_34886/g.110202 Transcript_34886/m.110202 type:complete len:201 (+) Transcript_34886:559-1161(+)
MRPLERELPPPALRVLLVEVRAGMVGGERAGRHQHQRDGPLGLEHEAEHDVLEVDRGIHHHTSQPVLDARNERAELGGPVLQPDLVHEREGRDAQGVLEGVDGKLERQEGAGREEEGHDMHEEEGQGAVPGGRGRAALGRLAGGCAGGAGGGGPSTLRRANLALQVGLIWPVLFQRLVHELVGIEVRVHMLLVPLGLDAR